MRGVHDMGGVPGFGPILVEESEPVFHDEWEGRVFGMMTTTGYRRFPMRPTIESIEPDAYIDSGYYEKWLLALEKGLVESGTLTTDELQERVGYYDEHLDGEVPQNRDLELTRVAWKGRYSQRSRKYDGVPRFSVGDDITTRHIDEAGHTRLPTYAQGKRGVVHTFRGVYDLLDLKVKGVHKPEPVYAVSFQAHELWGDDAESGQHVYIDLWESYLQRPSPSFGDGCGEGLP